MVTSARFSSQEKQGLEDIVRDVRDTFCWSLFLAATLFKAELFVINDEMIAFGTAECTYFLGIDFILTEINAEERRAKVNAL